MPRNPKAIAIALHATRKARQNGGRAAWEDTLPEPSANVEDRRRQTSIRSRRLDAVTEQGKNADISSYVRTTGEPDIRGMLRAAGGAAQVIPWAQRAAAQRLSFAGGMLNSKVPGRTDKLDLNVPAGSYVIPSSVVSFLGQDNSSAGAGVLDAMFGMGPAGTKGMGRKTFRSPQARFQKRSSKYAEGGDVAMEAAPPEEAPPEEVPIIAAGGEYIIPPDVLMEKWGDLDHAHKVLDQFVKETRKKHIKTLQKLPGPAKS